MPDSGTNDNVHDVIVVGAGFAGLYALHRLRGLGFSTVVLERGGGIGGTWYWNRYPGARCDVESLQYSYSFSDEVQQEWSWSERYASQSEILRYIHFVADRFDLERDVRLGVRVVAAAFDEERALWTVRSSDGQSFTARYLIFATGCLSVPIEPDIPGLDAFSGEVYRTSNWPHEDVDFSGKRVAVVGTGSSGIQVIPEIAARAEHLYVLQRTPNYAIPGRNSPMDRDVEQHWKANYAARRRAALETRSNNLLDAGTVPGRLLSSADRERELERRWQAGGLGFSYTFPDLGQDEAVNRQASDFVRRKIGERVRDPAVVAALQPTEHQLGGRRLCVENAYYETFNRDNVTLVDLRGEPLISMTTEGFRTAGADHKIDALVLATGFDAFTGALKSIVVLGRSGLPLSKKWAEGPATYLGLAVACFPNLFLITGPGSPSVLSNVVATIEQHVDWIAECLAFARDIGQATVEARQDFENDWSVLLARLAEGTLISKTKSWYTGANVAGKQGAYFLYMGGSHNYARELRKAGRAAGFPGFDFDGVERKGLRA